MRWKSLRKAMRQWKPLKEYPELKCYFYQFTADLHPVIVPCQELSDEEIVTLAEKSGSFDFLYDPEEDIYSPSDGTPI